MLIHKKAANGGGHLLHCETINWPPRDHSEMGRPVNPMRNGCCEQDDRECAIGSRIDHSINQYGDRNLIPLQKISDCHGFSCFDYLWLQLLTNYSKPLWFPRSHPPIKFLTHQFSTTRRSFNDSKPKSSPNITARAGVFGIVACFEKTRPMTND